MIGTIITIIWISGSVICLVLIGYANTKRPDKKSDMDYLIAVIWPVMICIMVITYAFRLPIKAGEIIAKRSLNSINKRV
jgi:hypothetical protein